MCVKLNHPQSVRIRYHRRVTTTDQQIGRNLARCRGAMSQRDLAEAMKTRGRKWTHVTVGSIERGERPLRMSEALDVGSILGITLEELTGDETAVEDLHRSNAYQLRVDRVRAEIRNALELQMDIARGADSQGIDLPRARYWMDVQSLGAVLAEELLAALERSRGMAPGELTESVVRSFATTYQRLTGMDWQAARPAASDHVELPGFEFVKVRMPDIDAAAADFTAAAKDARDAHGVDRSTS